jgi:hypothetical protein
MSNNLIIELNDTPLEVIDGYLEVGDVRVPVLNKVTNQEVILLSQALKELPENGSDGALFPVFLSNWLNYRKALLDSKPTTFTPAIIEDLGFEDQQLLYAFFAYEREARKRSQKKRLAGNTIAGDSNTLTQA